METEKDRLEREIKVLEEAYEILDGQSIVLRDVIKEKKANFTALTRPAIKDGVLGRWFVKDQATSIMPYTKKEEDGFYTFHPLTIEELLPTLAQWVPGAVRWEYWAVDRIHFLDGYGEYCCNIPAPPRDDWESVSGEL